MRFSLQVIALAVFGFAALCGAVAGLLIAAEPPVPTKPLASGAAVPSVEVPANSHDWTQLGGSPLRNNVSTDTRLAVDWQVGDFDSHTGKWLSDGARNIRWVAPLDAGSFPYYMASGPAVSHGKVFVGSNNRVGYVPRFPKDIDLACLLCLQDSDGKFLWQFSSERLAKGRDQDWPYNALLSTPLVEGDRLWIVTNRDEIVCLDTEGFLDHENDGPYRDESNEHADEADVVWKLDLIKEFGVSPHNAARSSITAAGDVLFVGTSNGVDESHRKLPAPDAPSFLAIDKTTGRLLWSDNSPGRAVQHGQWSSPACGEFFGVPQVIFPGGDGWLYGFRGEKTPDGRSRPLWKFDCNNTRAPDARHGRLLGELRGGKPFDYVMHAAVICDGRVYAAVGEDPEHGDAAGILWCLDPTRRDDVSAEIDGRANPQSAVMWKYEAEGANHDGKIEVAETLYRTLGSPVISQGLVIIADRSGLVHCLDANSGHQHWSHDMLASVSGPALIAGHHIYVADEDGDVIVFELSQEKKIVAENSLLASAVGAPVAANGTLYILTQHFLFAIAKPALQ